MAQAEIHEVESLEDFTEFAYEQGWTDGLPVVPPTRLMITTTQSTGSAAIFAMVSGPLVGALGFHTREWIFGPNGGRANATIGRAIRLILWNIGRAHAGKLVRGTMGHPAAWSYCIGEEQQLSPWPPMHVDYGLAATDSAITVMKAGEHLRGEQPNTRTTGRRGKRPAQPLHSRTRTRKRRVNGRSSSRL